MSKRIEKIFDFIAHYKGPYSERIQSSIKYPYSLENCWTYKGSDKIHGGKIKITEKGYCKYKDIVDGIKRQDDKELNQILGAMRMVHDLLEDFDSEELLYFVYNTPEFEGYTVKSSEKDKIEDSNAKERIRRKLFNLG
ncbi:hypothetical protein [Methanonatronarchaeum sp. AMET-Sl]|uniref:hypothetical protein n=1 Tax=Methanonatronarchaeum sp. AMET-Sl TaxID=3037654 RepID=UPI00244DFEFB|nr:hypothetical protein [Methanonatronarchaeum sp. AMET-Sl]WGI17891.1 hypothetical protein QEN48_02475 [Methanonatronarchaeum sp. AMET-Sl]